MRMPVLTHMHKLYIHRMRPHTLKQVTPKSIYLHHYSGQGGLAYWTEGIIQAAARRYFGMQGLRIELVGSRHDNSCDHEVRPTVDRARHRGVVHGGEGNWSMVGGSKGRV